MEKIIKALLLQPGKFPMNIEIKNPDDGFEPFISGHIEEIELEDDVVIICSEYGKLRNEAFNRPVKNDLVMGNAIVCGTSGEQYASLSEDQIKRYEKRFHFPYLMLSGRQGMQIRPCLPSKYNSIMDTYENPHNKDLER